MSNIAAGLMAVVRGAPFGAASAENSAAATIVTDTDRRTASVRRYSERLRLACANGGKVRRGDAVRGFRRHHEETRLRFADRGATVVPLPCRLRAAVAETVFGRIEPVAGVDRRGGLAGRGQKPRRTVTGALAIGHEVVAAAVGR